MKDLDPLRIVPDPIFPRQHLLKMIFSGNVLWEMVKEAVAIQYGLPDHLREEDEEIVVEFLDLIKDYLDIDGDLASVREQRNAAKTLGSYISRLAERGFFVGASLRMMLLTGGVSEKPPRWPILVIDVQAVSEIRAVDADGNPLSSATMDPNKVAGMK